MSVFISYSTKDSKFVNQLSTELVKRKIHVWLDKWEMQPGDSLIDKIQSGLKDSYFLLVVLSKNSVDSEWCKKEINSGLMRELKEKKVVVIPILLDDCSVPLFLQEKVYADFRDEFDTGFSELIRPLSKLSSEHIGRHKKNEIVTDYAINWGLENEFFYMTIDLINWYEKDKKSILLQLKIKGCKNATQRYLKQVSMGIEWLMKESLISMMYVNKDFRDLNILVTNNEVYKFVVEAKDIRFDISFEIEMRAVLMGIDNGNDVVLNFVDFLEMLENGRNERI